LLGSEDTAAGVGQEIAPTDSVSFELAEHHCGFHLDR
jgi:hypothetical protein